MGSIAVGRNEIGYHHVTIVWIAQETHKVHRRIWKKSVPPEQARTKPH